MLYKEFIMKTIKLILILLILSFSINASSNGNESDKRKAFKLSIEEAEIGNYERAIEALNNIYGNYKGDYLVNLRLGYLHYLSKEYEQSVKFYQEAMRISDNSIEAMLGLTYPYSEMKKWESIKEIYLKIIDKDQFNYTANLRLGQIYLNNEDYLNAKKYLEKVQNQYPSDYDANLSLGWTYYYLGNNSKANKLFSNALIANPVDSSAIEGLNSTK
jgi:Tfp pilus assembly protein PilF